MAAQSVYTDELGQKIFDRIATTSLSVKNICKELHVNYSTVREWIANKEHPMADLYTRAKQLQIENLAEEILEIADDETKDMFDTEMGQQHNPTAVNRSKTRIDARKWLLSKLDPKKYGDKLEIENKGEITVKTVTFE